EARGSARRCRASARRESAPARKPAPPAPPPGKPPVRQAVRTARGPNDCAWNRRRFLLDHRRELPEQFPRLRLYRSCEAEPRLAVGRDQILVDIPLRRLARRRPELPVEWHRSGSGNRGLLHHGELDRVGELAELRDLPVGRELLVEVIRRKA